MSPLLIFIVLVFLGGIILLNGGLPHEKKTREQFLQELAKFLDGTLEPIGNEGDSNSFRIRFKFKGEEFVYEDLQKQGFKDKIYEAYLKVKIPNKLTLTFTEKRRSTKITTDIFIASEVSTQHIDKRVQLKVPKHLKDLKVFSNDPFEANKIFEDKKTALIFKQFKNVDARGYPFLSIEIVDGTVILEFSSEKAFNPNFSALQIDIPSIENFLEKLIVIVRKFKEKS